MCENRLEDEITVHSCFHAFREPLLREIIDFAAFPAGSTGLDAGCGIGSITQLLAEKVGKRGKVTGLDFSPEFIEYARRNNPEIEFKEGNINKLPFSNETFDWIWSADTVWPGPKELGCPAENPLPILREYRRVIRPGGSIVVLFWSSQKLLPGYPQLEARLNTTSSATAPFQPTIMDPLFHIFNCRYWLSEVGFKDIRARTFLSDINAPLHDNDKRAILILCDMFWGASQSEISEEDWQLFTTLTDPESENFILHNQYYYGFFTYTVFKGCK